MHSVIVYVAKICEVKKLVKIELCMHYLNLT